MRPPFWEVICGDSLAYLREQAPGCSVDAVVCDPPAGIDFMGKDWDCFRRAANPNDVGRENVFGRTSRVAPYSYGESGRVGGVWDQTDVIGGVSVNGIFGDGQRSHGLQGLLDKKGPVAARQAFVAFLTAIMQECFRALKPGGHALVWALPRTSHWTATALEDAGFEIRDSIHHVFGTGFPKSLNVSKAIDKAAGVQPVGEKPASLGMVVGPNADQWNACERQLVMPPPTTDAARAWEGWGTALKPAHEVWWLARKPFEGTVAENVQRWGVGALNVDACRVGDEKRKFKSKGIRPGHGASTSGRDNLVGDDWKPDHQEEKEVEGRFPPNMVISHADGCEPGQPCAEGCAVAEIDGQSGVSKSQGGRIGNMKGIGAHRVPLDRVGCERPVDPGYGDEGGASRFFPCFYQAKAPRAEKNAGLPEGMRNHHPTVKSVALMRWLCRLVTPAGGLVLDPFAGSGSTGCAAVAEGFDFLGIDRDPAYVEIAKHRLAHAATREKNA